MDIFLSKDLQPMTIGERCQPFESPDYLFELKLDGDRCIAYLDEHGTTLTSKRGARLLTKYPELAEIHKQANNRCVLDGELVIYKNGKPDFSALRHRASLANNLTINAAASQTPATLVVFDILYLGNKSTMQLPLTQRKALLEKTVTETPRLAITRTIDTEGVQLYNLVVAQGLEGIVAKEKASLYTPGRRTKSWAKIKNKQDDDFIICGYIPSEKANVATLVLGQYNAGGTLVFAGHVTVGRQRTDFANIQKLPQAKHHSFQTQPPDSDGAVWLEPRLVCTVHYTERTAGGKIRHPEYKGLRPDKLPAEALAPSKE